jgi:type I restriction enzyme R subunit
LNNRKNLEGKLGVFWHTQGSGKSFSMVMFARKVLRKIEGNWSFLIITDRKELDDKIYKNFVRSEVIGSKEKCRPTNSKELKTMLGKNKRFIFSLIHKFKTDTGKEYPKVSDRNDIIVMVDEAHRTQYKDLAENMRRAVPNANFIAFTGTPLLGAKRLTNQWFGDYVSEYNFKDAVDDGATVPIYYSRRVPKVGLENNFLDDDVLKIVEEENLNEEEIKKLENSASKILEVIKRDERLELIAKDIAHHFPRRGFLGKGMVVCVDKFTAVKMYDKVSKYWLEETMNFVRERNKAQTKEERERIGKIIDYMNKVEMCVVISESANEKEEFEKQGLDITRHRKMINDCLLNGKDIEDRFKDVTDPFQLVFVCAMWLTGFDVSNLSTLYLDKPMKGHTLMQAIARVNRVYPNKTCGNIVDYINVFQFMEKALAEYATGNDGSAYPAKNLEQLIDTLNLTIAEAENLLKDLGFNLDDILKLDALEFSDALAKITDTILLNEEIKEKFKVITNTMVNLYEASKPEIFEMKKVNPKFAPLYSLYKVFHNQYIDDGKIEKAKHKISKLLDSSVVSEDISISQYLLTSEKVIDLSKVDVDKLKKEIKTAKYKAIEIDNLKDFIETTLAKMIKQNTNRIKFSQRYKDIIDKYNAGATETEEYYDMLVNFVKEMKEENQRANLEGLTEEELEVYDLLIKDKKLTKDETQKVKLAAKDLFLKITKEKEDLFVVDWYKDAQPKQKVLNVINEVLDKNLPASYDQQIFSTKANSILSLFIDKTIQGIDICNKE